MVAGGTEGTGLHLTMQIVERWGLLLARVAIEKRQGQDGGGERWRRWLSVMRGRAEGNGAASDDADCRRGGVTPVVGSSRKRDG